MPKSDKEQKFYDDIWLFWTPDGSETPPCIRCFQPGVTLHEIEPRSTNRDWLDQPFNSVPVCNDCHEWAGENPQAQEVELGNKVTARLHAISDWKGSRVIRDIVSKDV